MNTTPSSDGPACSLCEVVAATKRRLRAGAAMLCRLWAYLRPSIGRPSVSAQAPVRQETRQPPHVDAQSRLSVMSDLSRDRQAEIGRKTDGQDSAARSAAPPLVRGDL
jgi:hypothetical protein